MVTLGLSKKTEDIYCLTVEDNGIGFPAQIDFRNHPASMGLQIVNGLTGQIKGTIELSKDAGTKFCLTFPKPLPKKNTFT